MIDHLAKDHVMSTDKLTAWTEIPCEGSFCVSAHWTGATGTLNGTLALELSNHNDPATNEYVISDTQSVAAANNNGNALVWDVQRRAGYFRVRYTHGSIATGTLNIRSSR